MSTPPVDEVPPARWYLVGLAKALGLIGALTGYALMAVQ